MVFMASEIKKREGKKIKVTESDFKKPLTKKRVDLLQKEGENALMEEREKKKRKKRMRRK